MSHSSVNSVLAQSLASMSELEVATAVEIAHEWNKRVACHARAAASVKRAVRNHVDCVYHCDFADEEALDMLEAAKDRVIVGPAFGLVHNAVFEGEAFGMTRDVVESMHLPRKLEATCRTYEEMRKRGIKVVIGGDYGFKITPMGQNARDIGHFVKFFGYTPADALRCATSVGGELMGHKGELGVIKPGALADILLVDGNPLLDQSVLVGPDSVGDDYEGRQAAPRSADAARGAGAHCGGVGLRIDALAQGVERVVEQAQHREDVSGSAGARRRQYRLGARRGSCAVRRETARENDADQNPRRRPPARPGNRPARRMILFVLVSGGFDLSAGSLVTLTVIDGSMLTANDPSKT